MEKYLIRETLHQFWLCDRVFCETFSEIILICLFNLWNRTDWRRWYVKFLICRQISVRYQETYKRKVIYTWLTIFKLHKVKEKAFEYHAMQVSHCKFLDLIRWPSQIETKWLFWQALTKRFLNVYRVGSESEFTIAAMFAHFIHFNTKILNLCYSYTLNARLKSLKWLCGEGGRARNYFSKYIAINY